MHCFNVLSHVYAYHFKNIIYVNRVSVLIFNITYLLFVSLRRVGASLRLLTLPGRTVETNSSFATPING
ncbi:hypothetical protein RIF29_39155 [Crotalaria pallida]|uniref:Uncharacterized protein n=1 Tax=Crotalaria pallida TaxID=3830 RepID=A0AAN9HM80_CROPI